MQDKINQFLKLQEIDTEIAEFEKSFEDLPKEISSLEKKIDSVKKMSNAKFVESIDLSFKLNLKNQFALDLIDLGHYYVPI